MNLFFDAFLTQFPSRICDFRVLFLSSQRPLKRGPQSQDSRGELLTFLSIFFACPKGPGSDTKRASRADLPRDHPGPSKTRLWQAFFELIGAHQIAVFSAVSHQREQREESASRSPAQTGFCQTPKFEESFRFWAHFGSLKVPLKVDFDEFFTFLGSFCPKGVPRTPSK